MFTAENMGVLANNGAFAIWHYDAKTRQEAGMAKAFAGYFPENFIHNKHKIRPGDAIYITSPTDTFHGWFSANPHEDGRLSIVLFGG